MKVDFSIGGYVCSSLIRAKNSQLQSMTNMATGYRFNLSKTDSGPYSNGQRVENEKPHQSVLFSTLHKTKSVSNTQNETLGKILTKMSGIVTTVRSKTLIDSNISMRAQALDIQRDATLMLLSA